jgi:hypothetical protein
LKVERPSVVFPFQRYSFMLGARIASPSISNSNFREGDIMFKKILVVVLVGLLVNMVSVKGAETGSKEEQQARFVEKVKKEIAQLGTGTDAQVKIKLRDNRKLKGYVDNVGEDSFVVVDAKTGAATTVAYPQVKQVKGNNLSTGVKIAIGAGVVLGILVALFLIGKNFAQ